MTHKPDAVEPDRVISDRHCVNCGHLYYDHLVAMNTIQTGECKHCRCYHPETASREQLWREVEQLTAELDKYRDACERLIGHYGDAEEWGEYIDCRGGSDGWMSVFSPTADNGADFARQVKAEIDNNAE